MRKTIALPTNDPAITADPTMRPCTTAGHGSAPDWRNVTALLIIRNSELAASVDRNAPWVRP